MNEYTIETTRHDGNVFYTRFTAQNETQAHQMYDMVSSFFGPGSTARIVFTLEWL